MNRTKNLFLGFLFTLLILVSITSISATDTNSTSTNVEKQDVTTQTVEPVKKATSTQVTKTQEKTDNKIKTTTKENKKETTKKQDTTNTKNTTKTLKTTTTKSLKQETTPGTFKELQTEIEDAVKGETITLTKNYARTDDETLINIDKTLTIDGQGFTINSNKGSGVFNISGTDVILKNMTITNNNGYNSAITVMKSASVTINNITFTNNTKLWEDAGASSDGGGAIYSNGTLAVNDCSFNNNTANYGGAINLRTNSKTTLNNVNFTNNTATSTTSTNNGGAIYAYSCTLNMTNANFTNNTAQGGGGAVYGFYNTNITMINTTFKNNKVVSMTNSAGGAVGISYRCTLNFTNGICENNEVTPVGGTCGAISCGSSSTLSVTNVNFTNNTAQNGVIGNTISTATIYIHNSTFENNSAADIIRVIPKSTTLNIQNSSFINNSCNNTFFNRNLTSGFIKSMYNNTLIGNNLTADMTITPTDITTKDKKELTITVTPVATWNTTIPGGKISLFENNQEGTTVAVTDGTATMQYTPQSGKYYVVFVYTDEQNNHTATTKLLINVPKDKSYVTAEALNTTATNVTIKATVKDANDNQITNGTVNVINAKTKRVVGTGNVDSDGTVTIKTNIGIKGDYTLNVTYTGNTNYNESSYELPITVELAPTKITTTIANNTYGNTSINVLLTTQDDEPVKNALITITIPDTLTIQKVTNNTGQVNVPLDLTAQKTYNIQVNYNGNNTYAQSSDNTLNLYVEKGASNIETDILNTTTTNTTIKVTITDKTTKDKITSGKVNITDENGNIITTNTEIDENGTATLKLTITQSEKQTFTINYSGNENYTNTTKNIEIDITKVATTTTINPISEAKIGQKITITGTVKDENENPANGKVKITIDDTPLTEVTLTDGTFTTTYTPKTDKTYKIVVTFEENNIYKESTDTTEVTVANPTTKLTIADISDDIKVGDNVPIKVTLTDAEGNPLANQDIIITINEKEIEPLQTKEDGTVTYDYQTTKTGALIINATYNGNNSYIASNTTKTIIVSNLQTTIKLDDITTKINDTNTLTIKVTDEKGNNVKGGRVIIKVNGKTLRDEKGNIIYTTVNDGTATVDVKFNQKAGTYTITAVYGGYSYYESSRNKNIKLTVTLRDAQLNFEDVKPTVIGDKISFKVKITDNNTPVNSGKVNIKINGKSLRDNNGNVIYATVNNGIANIEFTLPDTFQAKTYTLTAVYGDSSYNRAENTTQLTITNPTTIDTNIITTAHTIKSNDSTTNTNITLTNDNTPKAIKI